jgi:site-specific DNA-cytosine methylase
MKAVELFGGGGGAWQGLTAAGFEVVRSIEWDEAAHNVAKAAGCPSVQGDVRDLSLLDGVGDVDLLWSSFPCQAFSSAGKRKGASDERNGWPWTLDVVDEVKPRWFMAENVSGLLMHSGEHCGNVDRCPACYLHRVILPELSKRFAWVGWSLSDAADFGTPQHRRRICIVAGPTCVRWPKTTHAAPAKCLGLFDRRKPWTTVRDALDLDAFVVTAGVTGEGRPTSSTATIGSKGNAYAIDPKHPPATPDRPAPSMRSGGAGHSAPPMWLHGVRCIGGGRNPTADPKDQRTYRDLPDEPCTTLAAVQVGNAGPWLLDQPAPTMAGGGGDGGKGCGQWSANAATRAALEEASGRRRLTVPECRQLMGWDERYDALLAQQTKTAAYRILGNGCVPAWVEAHARAVLEADER